MPLSTYAFSYKSSVTIGKAHFINYEQLNGHMRGSRGEGDRGFAPPPGKSQLYGFLELALGPPTPLEKV